jgi:hypothetical protein
MWFVKIKIKLDIHLFFLLPKRAITTGAFRNAESGSPFIRHLSNAMETMEVNEDLKHMSCGS